MSAGDAFFVDSNLLLYYVGPVEFEKRRAQRSGWKRCGLLEPAG